MSPECKKEFKKYVRQEFDEYADFSKNEYNEYEDWHDSFIFFESGWKAALLKQEKAYEALRECLPYIEDSKKRCIGMGEIMEATRLTVKIKQILGEA